jgi:hypothetical protein
MIGGPPTKEYSLTYIIKRSGMSELKAEPMESHNIIPILQVYSISWAQIPSTE